MVKIGEIAAGEPGLVLPLLGGLQLP